MSNREICMDIINSFDESQLANVAAMLKSLRAIADDAADDAFCLQTYEDYLSDADPDRDEAVPLSDFKQELGL